MSCSGAIGKRALGTRHSKIASTARGSNEDFKVIPTKRDYSLKVVLILAVGAVDIAAHVLLSELSAVAGSFVGPQTSIRIFRLQR